MRDKKFKVWNKTIKEWTRPSDIQIDENGKLSYPNTIHVKIDLIEGGDCQESCDFEIVEYTGLKTTDKKEDVYDGDIIECQSENGWQGRYVVGYKTVGREDYHTFTQLQINLIKDLNPDPLERMTPYENLIDELEHGGRKIGFEIVGNIYENPELLE